MKVYSNTLLHQLSGKQEVKRKETCSDFQQDVEESGLWGEYSYL
jgi:hypothetical protein